MASKQQHSTNDPVSTLVALIRARARHITEVCRAYLTEPESFAGLTVKQREGIERAAASLTPGESFVWVHQRFAPYAPNFKRQAPLLSLQEGYNAMLAAGLIAPPAPYATFQEDGEGAVSLIGGAVKLALDRGVIEQRETWSRGANGRRKSYVLAVSEDAKAARARRGDKPREKRAASPDVARAQV